MTPVETFQDRFARFWLPPEEETGTARADVLRAMSRPQPSLVAGKAPRRMTSGLIAIFEDTTITTIVARPSRTLPKWVTHVVDQAEAKKNFTSLLSTPDRRPAIITKLGKAGFGLTDIVPGSVDRFVVNEAGRGVVTDIFWPRVDALVAYGPRVIAKAKQIRAFAEDITGTGLDEMDALALKLGLDNERLDALLTILAAANNGELRFAAQLAKERGNAD